MNKILLYTVQHTGTTFIRALIESVYGTNNTLYMANNKLFKKGIARNLSLKLENYSFKEIEEIFNKNKKANVLVEVISAHHYKPENTKLLSEVKTNLTIPTVTSIRDPLYMANTRLCRIKALKKNFSSIQRQEDIERQIKCLLNILSLENKVFIYPIDLKNSKEYAFKLLQYCKLPITSTAKKFITKYPLLNTTSTKIAFKKTSEQLLKTKKAIKNNNISIINKYLKIEFEYLQKQEKLKKIFKNIGYTNLIWY